MRARTVLLDAVDARWKKYRSELKTCRTEFSGEAVHDLRVAVRRLLAIFDLLRSVIHHPRIQRIRRELKDQLDNLDELRDVQVLLADISEFVHDVPELTIFREFLTGKGEKAPECGQEGSEVSKNRCAFHTGRKSTRHGRAIAGAEVERGSA